jgi:iron complex outermembrane recepter protein
MRSIWFAGGLMAMAMWTAGSGTARAQTAEAKSESADNGALEEIIVSARRRSESLHDTPVAITAISTSQLESKAAINIGDLQGAAPNILITQQNSGAAAANLSIRGLTFADIEKSFDPTVAVVVDGVFMGTSTGQFFDFFDISKLEILRGPQGTLFGRNTIGGVINITRSRPTGDWGGKFDLTYGKFGTSAVRGVVNVPVIKDVLAAKLFFFKGKSDGFYTNAFSGDHVGGYDNKNYGFSLLFTPGENFNALLTIEKQKQTFDTVNANIAKTGEVFCLFEPANECNRNTKDDLYTVFTQPAGGQYSSPAQTLEMNWDVGGVHLTSVTGHRTSDEDQTQDFDSSSADLYFTRRVQTFRQFSQELRASGKFSDRFDYVAGLYYYDSKYVLTQDTRLFGADLPAAQVVSGTAKSSAVFADFNWQFIDQWRLNFGGRYTKDKKSLDNTFGAALGNPSASFNKFTPKVAIDWRPNEDYMFYASFSRGYRSGGFSNRAQTQISTNTPYQPEIVDSTEVGAKLEFFDRRLAANIALFNAKYKGLQQNTTIPGGPTGNETIVTNVGSAKIRGVELDIIGRATQNLTLNLSLGTLNSHFDGFITTAPVNGVFEKFDYSQNDLIYNPKFTLALGAQYKQPVSFGEVNFNVGYRHIAEYDQQISLGPVTQVGSGADLVNVVNGNDPRVRAAAQNLVDASVSTVFDLHTGKLRATVYGRNLSDDRGTSAAFTVAGLWSFASAREPRTYGVTLGYEF